MTGTDAIGVLCVDDNQHVAEAVRLKISRTAGLEWKGWIPAADTLVGAVQKSEPRVVLLDIDMPGRDPFEAMAELANACPEARVVIYSAHVSKALIDRAIQAGAWGYVSKNDGIESLVDVIRKVAHEEFAMSPDAEAAARA